MQQCQPRRYFRLHKVVAVLFQWATNTKHPLTLFILGCITAMEALGAVSATLSLVDVMVRSSSTIHGLISRWRDVPTELVALGSEIDDSKAILNQVCHLLRLLEDTLPLQAHGPDSPSPAAAMQRQVDRATPIWEELQGFLKRFSDGDSRALRFRWLRCQKKIERLRKTLAASRRSIQELLAPLSA